MFASVAGEVAVVAVDHGQAGAHVAGEVEGGDAGTQGEGPGVQASMTNPSSLCGSAMMSIATMRPPTTVKPTTEIGLVPGATTRPAAPLTSAGRANRANVGARSSS